MSKRLIVAIILVPIGAGLIAVGGLPYALAASLVLGLAAWEFDRLFRMTGLCPSRWLLIGGSAALVFSRYFLDLRDSAAVLSLLVLAAMAVHLVDFERGRDRAATDFGVTVAGLLYIGWIGAYLISLRQLPDGKWWVLTILPAVWLADASAMVFGITWGKHILAPRISPRKTWEGFAGGILGATLFGALLGGLWGAVSHAITPWVGGLSGLAIGLLSPLGDLGESMIKRQASVKDSSQLIPGHGGVFDRIDSWLWAGVIGYYLALVLH